MEMNSEVNLKMIRSFQDHWGPFEAILGLFLGLNLKLRQTSHVTTDYYRVLQSITVHNLYFVKYDVTVSFMAQVLDTVTYFVSNVLDSGYSDIFLHIL